MSNFFQVLRCYKCLVFQIHPTKKSNKWQCKMCSEKQSIKRHYGLGTGKDCRLHVQKLNGLQGNLYNSEVSITDSDEDIETIDLYPTKKSINIVQNISQKPSKWSKFVDDDNKLNNTVDESTCLGDTGVLLEMPKKQKQFKSIKRTRAISTEQIPIANYSENLDSVPYIKKTYTNSDKLNFHNVKYQNENNDVLNKKNMPITDSNFKWTGLAKTDHEINLPKPSITTDSLEQSSAGNLFTLCDDKDLDEILNI